MDAAKVKEVMEQEGYLFRIFEYEDGFFYRINVAPMEIMEDFMRKFRSTIEMVKTNTR